MSGRPAAAPAPLPRHSRRGVRERKKHARVARLRASHSYSLVLGLILVTFAFTVGAPDAPWTAGALVLLTTPLFVSLAACQPDAETAPPQVRPVRTVTVVKRDVGETVSYTGRIEALNRGRARQAGTRPRKGGAPVPCRPVSFRRGGALGGDRQGSRCQNASTGGLEGLH